MSNFKDRTMCTVIEDCEPDNLKKGANGESFLLKFSPPLFNMGEIITYDIFEGLELYIEDVITVVDEYAIYKFLLINNDKQHYIDNFYVQKGINYFRVSSPRASYQPKVN